MENSTSDKKWLLIDSNNLRIAYSTKALADAKTHDYYLDLETNIFTSIDKIPKQNWKAIRINENGEIEEAYS